MYNKLNSILAGNIPLLRLLTQYSETQRLLIPIYTTYVITHDRKVAPLNKNTGKLFLESRVEDKRRDVQKRTTLATSVPRKLIDHFWK